MNATDPSFATILQTQGNLEHYHVPKYQREYTWGRTEWEQLLNDIEENGPGYFMGSIICIDNNEELGPGESRIFEVVDGQQRLTTLSLMLMAIYQAFKNLENELEDDDEETRDEYRLKMSNIRNQLVHKKKEVNKGENGYFKDKDRYCFLRVQPSTQRSNYDDYLHTLNALDLIKGDFWSKFYGVRRIAKTFDYFKNHIPTTLEGLDELLHKINSLKFIHISVGSSSDAFTLFESLNNRGVPLSVMDIIKNKMLANLEIQEKMKIDVAYEEWQDLLEYLPEYKDQERFLRHYYNAFKIYPNKKIERYTKATKSSLIKIYEHYIKKDAKTTFEDLIEKAKEYNYLVEPEEYEDNKQTRYLIDLNHIGSAPSYLLLLYLYSLEEDAYKDKDKAIEQVLDILVKYYLRRNVTDFPNTRDLDAINMEVIELCHKQIESGEKLTGPFIIDALLSNKGNPSSILVLKGGLADNLFDNNSWIARYVLTKLDEMSHTREYKPDLWQRNEKGLLVWTVEHILPQGKNIPNSWVVMIAGGDEELAKDIQEKWVHCLGNLTLSGYNSKLSNASFEVKQDLHENKKFLGHKINIGYKNGLSLNNLEFEYEDDKTSLSKIPVWNQATIEARNNKIVDMLLKIFAFSEEEFEEIETPKEDILTRN